MLLELFLKLNGTLNNIDHWESDSNKSVTVILARIILRSDSVSWNSTTKLYNNALEAMALARITNGDRIIIVDMANALSYPDDLVPRWYTPNPRQDMKRWQTSGTMLWLTI